MAQITWPGFAVASFRWNKMSQALIFRNSFGSQAIETTAPLITVDMTGIIETRAHARVIQSFLDSLNGFVNQVELWNVECPRPAGMMRGTMVLATDAAQGDTSLTITAGAGQAGKTLLTGDLLGFGSGLAQQVVRISADASADGTGQIVVPVGTPLRNAFSAGAAVTWDKPKALFRQKSLTDGIEFVPEAGQPWTLSLIEDWRP